MARLRDGMHIMKEDIIKRVFMSLMTFYLDILLLTMVLRKAMLLLCELIILFFIQYVFVIDTMVFLSCLLVSFTINHIIQIARLDSNTLFIACLLKNTIASDCS